MHERSAGTLLRAALADTPVVLLHGARQTGKSTLARHIAGHRPPRAYLTLDDAIVLGAARHDPDGFTAQIRGPVVIDEVQRAPELFRAIKASVDRDRSPGRFLLTGSANVFRMPRLGDSLAGRVEIVTLWPLSQSELAGVEHLLIDALFAPDPELSPRAATIATDSGADLLNRIIAGGYPEPLQRPPGERRDAWFSSYLATILDRDVRDLADIADLTDLPRLLALIATRAGGLLNYADLSRSLSIPATTLKRYFALLETTFLVVTIPAWSGNLGLRLSKSPKVLLADTGLACHLLGVDRARLESADQLRGSLLENFVAMEILKQASWSHARPRLLHFRTAAGREADLVLESRAGQIVGIEIKATASPGPNDFAGLTALRQAAGDRFIRGVLFYAGSQIIGFGSDMHAVPISWLWSTTPNTRTSP